jgi:dolichol-phosphate mannosyltransferase
MITYSLIIPIYNEEENITELYHRLKPIIDSLDGESEFVLIDDGSKDNSLKLMSELHQKDSRVKYLSFARNFGHQTAVTAGLNFAQGEAIIVLDADLQDPPELIPELIEKWKQGYHVVYAQRINRKQEGWFKRLTAYVFYRILNRLTNINIPTDTGDFCLMSRQVVDILNSMPETNRYIRGLRAWVGFPQIAVKFHRESRFAGDVKYTFIKSLKLAIDGILSLSKKPLRIATYLGLVAGFVSLLMVFLVLYWRFIEGSSALVGYAMIACAVFFLGAVQLICLGIIGEYIGRIYDEVKGRPIYTLKEVVGL